MTRVCSQGFPFVGGLPHLSEHSTVGLPGLGSRARVLRLGGLGLVRFGALRARVEDLLAVLVLRGIVVDGLFLGVGELLGDQARQVFAALARRRDHLLRLLVLVLHVVLLVELDGRGGLLRLVSTSCIRAVESA